MKIPLALANAAEASLPTLVDDGKVCFRIRRTQAKGGSNSTAAGGGCVFSSSGSAAIVSAFKTIVQMAKTKIVRMSEWKPFTYNGTLVMVLMPAQDSWGKVCCCFQQKSCPAGAQPYEGGPVVGDRGQYTTNQ
jgi:hypothetical protein